MNDEDIRFMDTQVKLRNLVAEFKNKIGTECGDDLPLGYIRSSFYNNTGTLFYQGNYPYTLVVLFPKKIFITLYFEKWDTITKSQINNIKVEVREGCHLIITGEKLLGADAPNKYLEVYFKASSKLGKFGREVVLPFYIELKDIERQNVWDYKKRGDASPFASGRVVLEILKPTDKALIRNEPIVLY